MSNRCPTDVTPTVLPLVAAFDVQSASIHGIFGPLYGTEKLPRLASHDARSIARLAARHLEKESGDRAEAVQGSAGSTSRLQSAIPADWARDNGLLLTALPADYRPDSDRDYSPLCYLERLELTNRGWQITSRMAGW
jgi:hypothetical protein